jgi:hypothetical protein
VPSICKNPDYEAELGVVIGRQASRVSTGDALDFVRGYVVANDVSGRDIQFSDGQWVRGKSLDTFLPVGDLVPASEVPDPQALPIRAILNGTTMQDSNTSNQIFGVAEVIAFVSQAITLEPGDLIITGTPAGVGAFRKPPVWLQPGDEITIEIDGVGRSSSASGRSSRRSRATSASRTQSPGCLGRFPSFAWDCSRRPRRFSPGGSARNGQLAPRLRSSACSVLRARSCRVRPASFC